MTSTQIPSKEQRFRASLRDARAYRKELVEQLTDKIKREDSVPLKTQRVDWGLMGKLEETICLLENMLDIER